jgi:hypothetical protein
MIKSRRIRRPGHVARMGEKRNACRILVGKPLALALDLMSQPIRNRRLKRFAPNDLPGRF